MVGDRASAADRAGGPEPSIRARSVRSVVAERPDDRAPSPHTSSPSKAVVGRLADGADAPVRGEWTGDVARLGDVVVSQILSGTLDRPVDYCQDHDELAVVLDGAAVVEVDGQTLELSAGNWVLLPAGTPHRLVSTTAGTTWLTVAVHPRA